MMDKMIGKFIRDKETGDIGQIIELKDYTYGWRYKKKRIYYLIRWIHFEDKSWHKSIRKENYAQYTPENISEPNGRFEILTGSEAMFYVI